jgi:gliding motility-associatede transport system auxiliary component
MANRIFNIIGWIGTALVVGALAIKAAGWLNYLQGKEQYAFYLALAGLVCMLLYILSQWREIAAMFTKREARYGSIAAASVLIVLGILVAINYIGKRQNKRWDLTASKQFSLSDQSRNIVSKLDAPLTATVFAPEPDFQMYRDRLKEYTYSSKNVQTDFIDPVKKPAVAQQNGITQNGTILLSYKGRSEKVTGNTEQDITNGIIKVTSGQQKKVYFTTGHGERDTASSERDGYNQISGALGKENYAVDKIVLAQIASVPDDATVVVVAGPQTDFFPKEVDELKAFLAKGGKLLLMIDPPAKVDSPPLTNLLALAHDWDIDLGNNAVVDVSGMGQLFGASEAVPVAASYPSHPITDRFRVITAYPLARSVDVVAGGVNGHNAQPLVQTSPQSWAETDLKGLIAGTAKMDEGKDKPGPITLGAAVSAQVADATKDPAKPAEASAPKSETRVVVFGDSDFASNGFTAIPGNRDLFLNTLGWLSQQENLISIRPKEADDRRLNPMPAATQAMIMYGAWLGVPLLIFGAGIYSWWRRR